MRARCVACRLGCHLLVCALALVLSAVGVSACRGKSGERPATGGEEVAVTRPAAVALPAGDAADGAADDVEDAGVVPDDAAAAAGDGDGEVARLGAMPAWAAVLDRGHLLARRGKSGVIYGRLGAAAGRYRWLIDETEGSGALGVRLFAAGLEGRATGDRVAAWGAWLTDDERHWYWQASRVTALAPRPWQVPPEVESLPGHEIATLAAPPAGAVPVSEARAAGDIVFEVVRIPNDPALGWEIADRTEWRPVARLILPGERRIYGDQDFRAAGERWQLARKTRYVVRVKRFWIPGDGRLTRMVAVNAPRRLAQ